MHVTGLSIGEGNIAGEELAAVIFAVFFSLGGLIVSYNILSRFITNLKVYIRYFIL